MAIYMAPSQPLLEDTNKRTSTNCCHGTTPKTCERRTAYGHTAHLEGKLLGLLSFADKGKAASYSDAACSLKLVAGVGFEPTTFRL